jgi:hypothetical protein
MINGGNGGDQAPAVDPRTRLKIAIELSVGEWNQVLAVLSDGPFKMVGPIIGQIMTAANRALAPPAPPGAQPRPNGPIEGEEHGLEN